MDTTTPIDEMTVRDRQDFRTAVSKLSDRVEILRQGDTLVIRHDGEDIAEVDLDREVLKLQTIDQGRNRWIDEKLINMAPMFGLDVREGHLGFDNKPKLTESTMSNQNRVQKLVEKYQKPSLEKTEANEQTLSEANINARQSLMGLAHDWGDGLKKFIVQELKDRGYNVEGAGVLGIEFGVDRPDGYSIDPAVDVSVSDQTIGGVQVLYLENGREVSDLRQGIDIPMKGMAETIVDHFERKVLDR